MAERIAEIDGHPVWLMEMTINERTLLIRKERPLICPLCRIGWINHVPTIAKTLLSNGELFPNSACHQGCIDSAGGMQAAAEKLKAMYDECKEARERFVPLGWLGTWPT